MEGDTTGGANYHSFAHVTHIGVSSSPRLRERAISGREG